MVVYEIFRNIHWTYLISSAATKMFLIWFSKILIFYLRSNIGKNIWSCRLWLRGRTGREGGGRKRWRKPEWRWNTRLIKFKVTRYKWRRKTFLEYVISLKFFWEYLIVSFSWKQYIGSWSLPSWRRSGKGSFLSLLKYDYIVEILISLEV